MKGLIRRVVVDCPKSAIEVWKWQIDLHLNIPYTIYEQDKLGPEPRGLQFLLINFEQSWRVNSILQFRPDAIIVDESHRIKNPKSKQSQAAARFARLCNIRIAMTGTPIDKDEKDLWAQFRFVNPSIVGSDLKEFERRWCRKAGYGNYERKVKKHLKKKFLAKLAPHTFRITRKEALNLPAEQDYIIPFSLTGEAERVYQELEEKLYTEIKDELIVTPMRITQMIKLQQVTGGTLLTEDSIIRLNQDKLSTFRDWLHDYPTKTKMVIFAKFTEEINALEWLMENMGYTHGTLTGRTKDRTIWRDFQENKDPTKLILQVQSGGESIETSVADIGVFYSKSFSYLQYDQCRARLLGRRKKTMFVHLLANFTIDTDLMKVLNRKGRTAEAVLAELKRRRESWQR